MEGWVIPSLPPFFPSQKMTLKLRQVNRQKEGLQQQCLSRDRATKAVSLKSCLSFIKTVGRFFVVIINPYIWFLLYISYIIRYIRDIYVLLAFKQLVYIVYKISPWKACSSGAKQYRVNFGDILLNSLTSNVLSVYNFFMSRIASFLGSRI